MQIGTGIGVSFTRGVGEPTPGPTNTAPPAVSGATGVGDTLTTTDGTWTGTGPITYTYQWQRNGVSIPGATSSTYTLVIDDAGATIRSIVTATDSEGSRAAASAGTAIPEIEPSTTVSYMLAGAPTTDSMRVAVGTASGATDVRMAYSTDPGMAGALTTSAISTATTAQAATFDLLSLAADTVYYYQARVDGILTGPIQSARTMPDHTGSLKIAFGSCFEANATPVWGHMASRNPDMFISMGDAPYIDDGTNNPALYRGEYKAMLGGFNFPLLLSKASYVYTWDDHDYGVNGVGGADATTPSKPAVQQVYRELFPHYTLPDAAAIYHAFDAGPIRCIVMDTRSERTSGDYLGAAQLAWLKAELQAARDAVNTKMVVLVSSGPWLGTISDGWFGASAQRQEISDHIFDLGLENRTLVINGDAHMLAFDDGTNNTHNTGGRVGFPVAVSAPVNRDPSTKGGTYTTPGIITSRNQFTIMDVVPNLGELDITLTGISADATAYTATFTTADGNHAITAPSTLNLSSLTVPSDAVADDVVGTFTTDAGGDLTYTLTSDPSGNFKIVGDELQVASGATLTADATHAITAQVGNINGTHSESFTITVSAASSSAGQVVQYHQTETSASTSAAITLPVAPTTGNLIVVYCTPDKNSGAIATPAGFTVVDSHEGAGGEVSGVLVYKVSDGTETGPLSFSWEFSRRSKIAIVEANGPIGGEPIVLSKGANKTEALANSVSITGDASVTVNAVAFAFYSNDSQSNGLNASYSYTGGFLPIPGTDTYKNTGGGDQGAPLLIGGYKIITATETPSLSIGHDGSTDGSIGFMAAFKLA